MSENYESIEIATDPEEAELLDTMRAALESRGSIVVSVVGDPELHDRLVAGGVEPRGSFAVIERGRLALVVRGKEDDDGE